LKDIIDELRQIVEKENLEPEQKEELDKEAEILALEAKSSKPKVGRIKDSLSSIQAILQPAAVGVTIAEKIGNLLSSMPLT
jgi:U3 small nucleolar ribonucleoprotein component